MKIELDTDEIKQLLSYHKEEAEYYEACAETQLEIANKEPLYIFGDRKN